MTCWHSFNCLLGASPRNEAAVQRPRIFADRPAVYAPLANCNDGVYTLKSIVLISYLVLQFVLLQPLYYRSLGCRKFAFIALMSMFLTV